MKLVKPARIAALLGFFGLLGVWIGWSTIFAPPRHAPTALVLGLTILPLLFPLRGLLHDRRNSFIWLGLLSLGYFIHGVGAATDAGERIAASWEIVSSLLLFTGSWARLRREPSR
ncbi:MAG: DUF2069 domain-containing protein [Methylococcaceae bacterium]|nr:DUF2069 domain-containing protein [Methylococcaceae bacterium]